VEREERPVNDYTGGDESDESGSEDQADESSSSDQGYGQDQSEGDGQCEGDLDPSSVTYAEAQTESDDPGDEVSLSDDDIAAVLQEAGISDDGGYV
jgi:hypothetical protein